MIRNLVLCAIVILSSFSAVAQTRVPRVGIISDAGARAEADLLMLELQKARCELVERDEVSRVLGEQTLQSVLSREGSQRIGRLLKADGLVVLTSSRPGQISFQYALIEGTTKPLTSFTNQTLTVRFIAVEPGVLTYLAESPAGATNWAVTTTTALGEYFPKLSVKADAAPARAEGPRIGILSDAGSRKEADLLMVELQKARCELVERDEIKKVVNEQALQTGLNRAESVRVGQMLKADGLLVLASGSNDTLSARLVAVTPGVVLWYAELNRKAKHQEGLGLVKNLAANTVALLPKLAIKPGQAVPISLLRVRPALDTALAERAARDLHQLLQLRLVREPSLFVLERDNLRVMNQEQHWAGQESEFWAGSYLLEGTVAHEVTATQQITLRVLVRPRGSSRTAPGQWIQESGSTDKFPELVDRLVGRLCAHFGAAAATTAWAPIAEAETYYRSSFQLWQPAERRVALETAMALGQRTPNIATAYRDVLMQLSPRVTINTPSFTPEQLQRGAATALELLAFCAEYQPPGGFSPKEEASWLHASVIAPTPSAWIQVAHFLERVALEERQDELGPVLGKLLAAGRRLGDRVYCEQSRATARGCYQTACCARAYYQTAAELNRIYELLYLPQPSTDNAIGACGPGQVFPTSFEPVFPLPSGEKPAQSRALWEKFHQKRQAAATDPASRLTAAVTSLRLATDPAEIRRCQRALQDEMIQQHAHLAQTDFFATQYMFWQPAFPNFDEREGAYWRSGPDGHYTQQFDLGELREDAAKARALYLAMLQAGSAPGDAGGLLTRYLPLYTQVEAAEVLRALRAKHSPAASFEIARALFTRFPALTDQVQQREIARRAEQVRQALAVTKVLNLPPSQNVGGLAGYLWKENLLWFGWHDELFTFDPRTRKILLQSKLVPADAQFQAVTDNYILFVADQRPNGVLWWRRRTGGVWQSVKTPFVISSPVEMQRTLYCLAQVARPGRAAQSPPSIVEITPVTGQITTLFDPLQGPPAAPKTPANTFAQMTPPRLVAGPEGRLLCGEITRRLLCAFDPASRTWQSSTLADWQQALPDETAAQAQAKTLGFELFRLDASSVVPEAPGLRVRLPEGKGDAVIPLIFDTEPSRPASIDKQAWNQQFGQRVAYRALIQTPSSVLIPLLAGRGFWEIPNTELQAWLATNAAKPSP